MRSKERSTARPTIETEGENGVELVRRLHTRTRFTVKPATLKGFDLAKAVSTAGADRSGQTVFDELTGTLDTQAGEDGIVPALHRPARRAPACSRASGSATVFNRRLTAKSRSTWSTAWSACRSSSAARSTSRSSR